MECTLVNLKLGTNRFTQKQKSFNRITGHSGGMLRYGHSNTQPFLELRDGSALLHDGSVDGICILKGEREPRGGRLVIIRPWMMMVSSLELMR